MKPIAKQLTIAALVLGGLLLIAVVGLGTYGYQRYYKPIARPLMFVSAAETLERSLRNTTPFQPPPGGGVSPGQWRSYCEVETAVGALVGSRIGTLSTARDALVRSAGKDARSVDLRAVLGALGEIGPVYLKAKQVQIEALNRSGLSMEEYRWVRRRALAVAGSPLAELDVADLRTAPQDRRDWVGLRMTPAEVGDAALHDLVAARGRASLDAWTALAFFDL